MTAQFLLPHASVIDTDLLMKGSFPRLRTFLKIFLKSYGLQVIISYRFCRWTSSYQGLFTVIVKTLLRTVAFLLHKLLERMYDIHISLHADIAPGLYIGHFGGIRIGSCAIGYWCNINHQILIGQGEDTDHMNTQIFIGDRVWIGAHSKIDNGVTIGNGATVSVGTFASKDIPPSALVAGSPCRVLQKDYDNSLLLGLPEK